jgi:hypothetical protein
VIAARSAACAANTPVQVQLNLIELDTRVLVAQVADEQINELEQRELLVGIERRGSHGGVVD